MRREIRQDAESLSEKEANDLLARFIEAENKMHLERTQLVEKLRAVIPAKKIILLKVAEEEFNRKILEQMKNFRDRRQKNKP
jgi:flagellar biosynthesis/type III secretory pathway chaperone